VKVRIQCDDNTALTLSMLQDIAIDSSRKADFAGVNGVDARIAQ